MNGGGNRRLDRGPGRCHGARFALVATLILLPGALVSGPGLLPESVVPIAGADDTRATPERAATGERTPARRGGAERPRPRADDRAASRERDPMRALGPDPVEAVIEVAEEVSIEWGQQLRSLRDEDPAALRRSIASNGRRLVALAVLRDREPELYRLKVTELRIQSETAVTLNAYRDAVSAGKESLAAALLEDVRRSVRRQVDHDLRTRGEELAALDLQVQRLKQRLIEDALNRDERIAAMLDELIASDPGTDAPWNVPSTPAAERR